MIDYLKLPQTGDYIAHDVFVNWAEESGDAFITPAITGIGAGTINIRLTASSPPLNGSRLYAIPYTYLSGDDGGFGSAALRFSVVGDPFIQEFEQIISIGQTVYLVAKLVYADGLLSVSGAIVLP